MSGFNFREPEAKGRIRYYWIEGINALKKLYRVKTGGKQLAEFLTTSGAAYHLEKIINEANEKLILLSPYLQLSKTLYERLKDADHRKVRITIIFGKSELEESQNELLHTLENLELRYFDNLHAKCYCNEKHMVITSMNVYEFSLKTNREMGVLFERNSDSSVYKAAFKEINSIFNNSEIVNLKEHFSASEMPELGYCIRCSAEIEFNRAKPLCEDCFNTWDKFKDAHYGENVCHRCCKPEKTCYALPECRECFDENYGF